MEIHFFLCSETLLGKKRRRGRRRGRVFWKKAYTQRLPPCAAHRPQSRHFPAAIAHNRGAHGSATRECRASRDRPGCHGRSAHRVPKPRPSNWRRRARTSTWRALITLNALRRLLISALLLDPVLRRSTPIRASSATTLPRQLFSTVAGYLVFAIDRCRRFAASAGCRCRPAATPS